MLKRGDVRIDVRLEAPIELAAHSPCESSTKVGQQV